MAWLSCLRRYLISLAAGHLAWEALQMPLYTLWATGSERQIVVYGLHCVAGDLLIGVSALVIALLTIGSPSWPADGFARVAAWAITLGIGYTAWSEWYNVQVKANWAYSVWMPIVPGLEIGLSPLVQWIVVPGIAFWWTARRLRLGRR